MKFCGNCGNKLEENDCICNSCGTPVPDAQNNNFGGVPQGQNPPNAYNNNPGGSFNPYGGYNYPNMYPPQQKNDTVSLVLGIFGLILGLVPTVGLILNIIGIIVGAVSSKKTGKSAGLIMSIIGLCLQILMIVCLFVFGLSAELFSSF